MIEAERRLACGEESASRQTASRARCQDAVVSYTCEMALSKKRGLAIALLPLWLWACGTDLPSDTPTCRAGGADGTCLVDGSREEGAAVASSAAHGGVNARSQLPDRGFREPTYFANGDQKPQLLRQVQQAVDEEIGFAGHFSIAYVACGTGCGSYWFVDRRSGAVLASPDPSPDGAMIWTLHTDADSEMLELVYGPRDGVAAAGCHSQSFRWAGRGFEATSDVQPVKCPDEPSPIVISRD